MLISDHDGRHEIVCSPAKRTSDNMQSCFAYYHTSYDAISVVWSAYPDKQAQSYFKRIMNEMCSNENQERKNNWGNRIYGN